MVADRVAVVAEVARDEVDPSDEDEVSLAGSVALTTSSVDSSPNPQMRRSLPVGINWARAMRGVACQ